MKTNRGLFKYIVFTVLTVGIYALYMIHATARELNISCAGDGKKTHGLAFCILFDVITLGIYSIVWYVTVCERMKRRIESVSETADVSGLGYFLWSTFGSLLFGLGSFIATYKWLHALNHVNEIYNSGR